MSRLDRFGRTKLYDAANSLDLKNLEDLLKSGMDPNEEDKYGLTALFYVLFGRGSKNSECFKQRQLIDCLCKYGANTDVINYEGNNLLNQACRHEVVHDENVEFLIKSGVNINNQNRYGITTLHMMCMHPPFFERALYLIKKGAKPHIKDCDRNYPSDYLSPENEKEFWKVFNKVQNWPRRKSSMIFLANQGLLSTTVVDGPTVLHEIDNSNNPKLVGKILSCLSQEAIYRNIISCI